MGLLDQNIAQKTNLQQVLPGLAAPVKVNTGLLSTPTRAQWQAQNDLIQGKSPVVDDSANVKSWQKYIKSPEEYAAQPKSQFEQDFEAQKGVGLDFHGSYNDDLMNVYFRDKFGKGLTDTMNEEEYLRRTGLSRGDVQNIVEQTGRGQDMLKGKLEGFGGGQAEQRRSPESEGFSRSVANLNLGEMDRTGQVVGGVLSSTAKKFGTSFLVQSGIDPSLASPLYNAIATAGTTQDVGRVVHQVKKDAVKYGTKAISKILQDKLKTTFPIAQVAGLGFTVARDIKEGMDISDALGDGLSKLGINVTASLIGSLLGPIGSFAVPLIMGIFINDNLVSEGFIGDAFDSRNNEGFLDAFEDFDLSAKDMSDLKMMAKSTVGPASQLTQLERIRGYGTGSGTGGFNVGGAKGTKTQTGGGFNIGGGNVSGL